MIRDILLKDAFTVIILLLIIIITLIKYNNPKKFKSLLKIFWNSSYLKKYKYEKITYYLFDYFLQINFVISLGLFAFIYAKIYNGNSLAFNFLEFINIILIGILKDPSAPICSSLWFKNLFLNQLQIITLILLFLSHYYFNIRIS